MTAANPAPRTATAKPKKDANSPAVAVPCIEMAITSSASPTRREQTEPITARTHLRRRNAEIPPASASNPGIASTDSTSASSNDCVWDGWEPKAELKAIATRPISASHELRATPISRDEGAR
jgi:hypothetical protein